MERVNVLTKSFAAAAVNEALPFVKLIRVKSVWITTNALSGVVVTLNFGGAGTVRGLPAGWLQNQAIIRVSNSAQSRIYPNVECRTVTVDVPAGVTQVTIVYEFIDD